jgi:hypothetical protein
MSDTFTQLCDLGTLFPASSPIRNYGDSPNMVYGGDNVYGGYSTDSINPSMIFRFKADDPSGNNALLYSTKFNNIRAIAVDASNVYCFSSATPTKIYSCPLNFDASSIITDIDLTGVAIPSSTSLATNYYMIKTSSDFYIAYNNIIHRIPIADYTVYNFSSVPNDVYGLDINTIT